MKSIYEIKEKKYENKKLVCFIISFSLTFLVILPNSTFLVSAGESLVEEEDQKFYSRATIEDDFSDNTIMVVLKHDVSMELKEYSIEDFPEVGIKSVTDLSASAREKASVQLEKINYAFFNRTSLENEEVVSYKNYNQVICLELEERGKDKVLSAIEIIEDREDIIYAGPDFPIYTD